MQPLVALDLGSTKVACAIGLPHEQRTGYELLGSSLVPYPSISETWLDDALMVGRTIEQAIEATGASGDFHRTLVAFSHPALMSEQASSSIHLGDEAVAVRERDLYRLRMRAVDEVLSVDREALLIERLGCSGNGFVDVREPLGLPATRLKGTFHVLTMPMAARRAVVQAVEFAGLDVVQLTFSLQAMAASLASTGPQGRCLLVDLGGLTTDLGYMIHGRLHSVQTVPWGGLTLAMEVAKAARVTVEQAMALTVEGMSSRRPEVRHALERELPKVQRALQHLLKGQPMADTVLVGGRGALIDGIVEWIEGETGLKATVVRSPRLQAMTDMARQMGISVAIGLLESVTGAASNGAPPRSPRFVDRLIGRTRVLLTEYF